MQDILNSKKTAKPSIRNAISITPIIDNEIEQYKPRYRAITGSSLTLVSRPVGKRNTGAGIGPQVRVRTVNLLVKYSDTLPVELPVDFLFSGKPVIASTQNGSVKIYNRNTY